MKITRTLLWFKDGEEVLLQLNERFFGLSTLLNRLLNENYDGKKIKFINIDFSTEKTYKIHPDLPQNDAYYYGGHLRYYGVFDLEKFEELSDIEQNKLAWNKACDYLRLASKLTKNEKLFEACNYAHKKGMELGLNPDYRVIENDINIFGKKLRASVWINFNQEGMTSKFTLEENSNILFEKKIDKAKHGIEFFLEIYKKIEISGNEITIEGHKEIEYLPLKILVDEDLLKSA